MTVKAAGHKHDHNSRPTLIVVLMLCCVVAASLSILVGTASLPLSRMADALLGGGDRVAHTILFDLRMPRALLGLAVGAVLGPAGAVLQGYLRNPLAEPVRYRACRQRGRALGAVIAIFSGWWTRHPAILSAAVDRRAAIASAVLFLALLVGRSPEARSTFDPGRHRGAGPSQGRGSPSLISLSPNPFAADAR